MALLRLSLLLFACCLLATGAFAQDSDGDGLSDADEIAIYGSDPGLIDTDADTIGDGDEVGQGTSPISVDTDQDGVPDPLDNCPSAYNPLQADSATLGGASSDGVGDLCQNADFDKSGGVDVLDVTVERRALAGLEPELELAMPPRAAAAICASDPTADDDLDGFTGVQGDCNDCDPEVNPAAFDFEGNFIDDDCDGAIDNPPPPCDGSLALASDVAVDAARAIDICDVATSPSDSGLVSAAWVMADGATPPVDPDYDRGHGITPDFGPEVATRAGSRLLVLSSGAARRAVDPGFVDPETGGDLGAGFEKGFAGNAPPGFPAGAIGCPTPGSVNDPVALELALRVPSNANGLAVDFRSYFADYPAFLCSAFNDTIVALASGDLVNGNTLFDSLGNPVTVNGFIDVCQGGGPSPNCAGTAGLLGTGYETNGGTDWSSVFVPAPPGSLVTIRFAVWDSADGKVDSTLVLDNFRWSPTP